MQTPRHATPSLQATLHSGDGWTTLSLSGVIDERADMSGLVEPAGADVLVVETSGVERINSVGVRTWVDWMRVLVRSGRRIVLIDASPAIMDQVNLVRNFAEGAVVHSFMAPYFCDRCDLEVEHRLNTRSLHPTDGEGGPRGEPRGGVPAFPCDKPACAKSFDDVEDDFLAFLEDQPVPPDADSIDAVVAQVRGALAEAGSSEVTALAHAEAPQPAAGASSSSSSAAAAAPTRPPTDIAFVGMLVVLGAGLVLLVYLMLTLE